MTEGALLRLDQWIEGVSRSALTPFAAVLPWTLTADAETVVRSLTTRLGADWNVVDGIAVHHSALVEPGAVLKPPAIIGPNGFVAAGAYLRGGVWLDANCIVGPACELKSTFMLEGSKVAHLSFVGDSVIGADVNIEAGAMIANYRNERSEKRIRIVFEGTIIDTGVDKFGALVGDGARIGANAVIAPGALIRPSAIVPRLALVDQSPA